jgi:dienelactone hydrolase
MRLSALLPALVLPLASFADPLAKPADLPIHPDLPDPLVASSGEKIIRADQWPARREELKRLFQEYEYGFLPPKPAQTKSVIDRENANALGGKALLREVTLTPLPGVNIHLLLVLPWGDKPVPVFLGLNFNGNHEVLPDPIIRLPEAWMRTVPPDDSHQASDATRGRQEKTWNIEMAIARGYGVATFYNGDFVSDNADLAREQLKRLRAEKESGTNECATIAAWAWGLSRALDYLVTDPRVDAKRIAVVGHSRNGKTALLAGAMDERFALVIPLQAGCGGTAPCRLSPELAKPNERGRPTCETLAVINKAFPHWFCENFKAFNEEPARLPFDQHELIALCAPRPVLVSNATEDVWANPAGQFEMLKAADPVYRLISGEGLEAAAMPEPNKLVASRLGYFIRPGKHEMATIDWAAFLDYADRWLK